jgi:hypothetical protein
MQQGNDYLLDEREIGLKQEQIQKVERLKRESYLDYKEGLLTKQEYLDMREHLLGQEKLLQEKLDVLTDRNKDEKRDILSLPWIKNLLERQRIDTLDRDTIVEFLDKIEIGEKDADGQQKITIHYRFSDEVKDLFQIVYTDSPVDK